MPWVDQRLVKFPLVGNIGNKNCPALTGQLLEQVPIRTGTAPLPACSVQSLGPDRVHRDEQIRLRDVPTGVWSSTWCTSQVSGFGHNRKQNAESGTSSARARPAAGSEKPRVGPF
jgi:hypothetical protein